MDKYEIVKVVGQGSFGKALLCKRRKDTKKCIIKQIAISKMSRKEALFTEQEAKLLAKLQHPNIVTFWDSFSSKDHLYIVMEFADGGDLETLLKNRKGRNLSESEVMHLFVQLCLAIKHVHDRKILHRDLKSQNIFLTSSGLVKLGDFGVSRVMGNTGELASTQIGTPYYMSPEIMNGQRYNSKTDIWSLGCILYELLCLKLPFDGQNMRQLCHNIINTNPLNPPISYSRELRELAVNEMLAKNQKLRPSINSILAKPYMREKISRCLSETKRQHEFSHTVMHGMNIMNDRQAAAMTPSPTPSVQTPRSQQPSPSVVQQPSARQSPTPDAGRRMPPPPPVDIQARPPRAGPVPVPVPVPAINNFLYPPPPRPPPPVPSSAGGRGNVPSPRVPPPPPNHHHQLPPPPAGAAPRVPSVPSARPPPPRPVPAPLVRPNSAPGPTPAVARPRADVPAVRSNPVSEMKPQQLPQQQQREAAVPMHRPSSAPESSKPSIDRQRSPAHNAAPAPAPARAPAPAAAPANAQRVSPQRPAPVAPSPIPANNMKQQKQQQAAADIQAKLAEQMRAIDEQMKALRQQQQQRKANLVSPVSRPQSAPSGAPESSPAAQQQRDQKELKEREKKEERDSLLVAGKKIAQPSPISNSNVQKEVSPRYVVDKKAAAVGIASPPSSQAAVVSPSIINNKAKAVDINEPDKKGAVNNNNNQNNVVVSKSPVNANANNNEWFSDLSKQMNALKAQVKTMQDKPPATGPTSSPSPALPSSAAALTPSPLPSPLPSPIPIASSSNASNNPPLSGRQQQREMNSKNLKQFLQEKRKAGAAGASSSYDDNSKSPSFASAIDSELLIVRNGNNSTAAAVVAPVAPVAPVAVVNKKQAVSPAPTNGAKSNNVASKAKHTPPPSSAIAGNAHHRPPTAPSSANGKPKAAVGGSGVSPSNPKGSSGAAASSRPALSPAEIKEKRDAERLLLKKNIEERRKALKSDSSSSLSPAPTAVDEQGNEDWVDEILVMAVPRNLPPPSIRKSVDDESQIKPYSMNSSEFAVDHQPSTCDEDTDSSSLNKTVDNDRYHQQQQQQRDLMNASLQLRDQQQQEEHERTWRLDAGAWLHQDNFNNLGQFDYSVLFQQMQDILKLPTEDRHINTDYQQLHHKHKVEPEVVAVVQQAHQQEQYSNQEPDLLSYTVVGEDIVGQEGLDDEFGDNDDDYDAISDGTFDEEDIANRLKETLVDIPDDDDLLSISDNSSKHRQAIDPSAEAFEQQVNAIDISDQWVDIRQIEQEIDHDNLISNDDDEEAEDGMEESIVEVDESTDSRSRLVPTISDDCSDVSPSGFGDTLSFRLTASGVLHSVHHVHDKQKQDGGGLDDSVFPMLQTASRDDDTDTAADAEGEEEETNEELGLRANTDKESIKISLVSFFGQQKFDEAIDFLNSLDIFNRMDTVEVDNSNDMDDLDNIVMDGLEGILGLNGLKYMNELMLFIDD